MRDLSQGNELKVIFLFAMPILIGNFFQLLYNTIDTIIVGNFIGKIALASVGATFSIIFMMVSLVMGIGMGATVLIAQYYGAKQIVQVWLTISTLYIFLLFASLAVTFGGIVFAKPLLRLLNTPSEVMPGAVTYIRIYFSGMVLLFGFN